MSLYPSLEDISVDHMTKPQVQANVQHNIPPTLEQRQAVPTAPPYNPALASLYPTLEYRGSELTEGAAAPNVPQQPVTSCNTTETMPAGSGPLAGMVAPLSGQPLGTQRTPVATGVRELTLYKDKDDKIGLRVHAVNNGIFICLVTENSPAAVAGLKFGDQILSINDISVAGYTMEQVHKLVRNASANGIKIVVRDRSFERTVTMHKDNMGYIGFQFKNGKIIGVSENSSAARNGLLTDHQILEVNGKNVVGLKDKQITAEIENGGNVITITIIPSLSSFSMIWLKINAGILKTLMDHPVPDV